MDFVTFILVIIGAIYSPIFTIGSGLFEGQSMYTGY